MFNPRVARRFTAQAGTISRAQALSLGMSRGQIQQLLATHAWRAVLPKVYASSDVESTAKQALWAAFLYAGPSSRISHASAASLWNLEGIAQRLPELWISRDRCLRAPGLLVHRTDRLALVTARHIDGLRITSPERTIIDLAPRLTDTGLEWAIEQLRARRMITSDSLTRALEHSGSAGRAGAARLRSLLARFGSAPSESLLEVRVGRLLRESGLPAPERQFTVAVDGHRYRLDFAWAWRRVALECDGRRFHSDPAAFCDDRERWTNIGARLGYRIVFVTWHDVEVRPEWIVEQVAGALR